MAERFWERFLTTWNTVAEVRDKQPSTGSGSDDEDLEDSLAGLSE